MWRCAKSKNEDKFKAGATRAIPVDRVLVLLLLASAQFCLGKGTGFHIWMISTWFNCTTCHQCITHPRAQGSCLLSWPPQKCSNPKKQTRCGATSFHVCLSHGVCLFFKQILYWAPNIPKSPVPSCLLEALGSDPKICRFTIFIISPHNWFFSKAPLVWGGSKYTCNHSYMQWSLYTIIYRYIYIINIYIYIYTFAKCKICFKYLFK